MPVLPELRVAVWGARHIHTEDHLAAIDAHPRAVLAAIHPYPSPPPTDVDVVILDGLTSDHETQLRQLPSTTPVFVEKPLAIDLPGAQRVARELSARLHGTGLFLHHVPAVQHWLKAARNAHEVHLTFGHAARTEGAFDGRYAWMLDPTLSGGGTFADLGIHLAHLLHLLWPTARLASSEVGLTPDPDHPNGDLGGRAVLHFASGDVAHLETSSISALGLHLTAKTSDGTWTTADGNLHRDNAPVIDGPPPDAQTAVTAFLNAATHTASPLQPAPANELLTAHRLLAATLSSGT